MTNVAHSASSDRAEPEDRAGWITALLKDMRMHGLEPVPDFLTLSELYIAGTIALRDLEQACRRDDTPGV